MAAHFSDERGDVAREVVGGDAFGGRADDDAVALGLHVVDDLAESSSLAVGQTLGDTDGARVGNQHREATGQRDFLSEARALGADGVLGDLTDDGLSGLDHLFDALVVRRRPFDVVQVKGDVAAIQHRILRDSDVDKGQFHAR